MRRLKGVIFVNFIYLVVFLFVYLMAVPTVQMIMGVIASVFTDFDGVNYWDSIPLETWFLLNVLMYVLVPLGAIAWFIWSSKPKEAYYPMY